MYIGCVIQMTAAPDSAALVTYAARLVRIVTRAADDDAPACMRILSQLDELGPVGVGDLARADRASQPSTSAVVRILEQRGWVSRSAHAHDARSTLVVLTDDGHAALAAARRRNGEVLEGLRAAHGVDEDALRAAVEVLRTLTST